MLPTGLYTPKLEVRITLFSVYENPHQEVARIGDHMGFYWGVMDKWFEDRILVDGLREVPGRIDTTNQLKALFLN